MEPIASSEYNGWNIEFVQTRVSVVATAKRPGWRNLYLQALDLPAAKCRMQSMIDRTGEWWMLEDWRQPADLPY